MTKWTEEDELITLWLYYTIKGGTDKTNPEIIRVAEALGHNFDGSYRHSPSSVALKLSNYRSCDPNRIGGMPHTSADDRYYFDRYNNDAESLFSIVQKILIKTSNHEQPPINVYPDIPEFASDQFISGTQDYFADDKKGLTAIRTKQYQFRTKLLNIYSNHCCLSGIGTKELLIASHIKPWAIDKNHRADPGNGLLLNSLLDRSFDQGFFTVNPTDYRVIVSKKITDPKTKSYLLDYEGKQITLPDSSKWKDCKPNKEMLEYHNDMVFESFTKS